MKKILILIQCPDRVGLVAHISDIIASADMNIDAMREFVDRDSGMFFTRLVCHSDQTDFGDLKSKFEDRLGPDAVIDIICDAAPKRIAVLVTKEFHCLSDILVKDFFQTLGAEVTCVIGNHEVLKEFTERFDLPFHHVDHHDRSKEEFENEILEILDTYQPDYLILAKFMRILSARFVAQYPNRIINIHHSFLPAFIGANPYRQAFDRGVKVIGATAHFVTQDLDRGPIITQRTKDINHNFSATQMRLTGQETERSVLARAIKLVMEDRVFVTGNKTIIFE